MAEQIIFRAGSDFEAEAFAQDYFQSMEQLEMAAHALERAGFIERQIDDAGRELWMVVRDVSDADFAAVLSAHHKQIEETG